MQSAFPGPTLAHRPERRESAPNGFALENRLIFFIRQVYGGLRRGCSRCNTIISIRRRTCIPI